MPLLRGWWDTGDGVLLPPGTMAAVDRATIAGGVSGQTLMEAAGRAVTRAIVARYAPQPVIVLCGPGNNGGDGYVCGRQLRDAGWPVSVASWGDPGALRGDAAWAWSTWDGAVEPLDPRLLDAPGLVVDALFGAGLARDIDGVAREVIDRLNSRQRSLVAIDIPSGVDGATGAIRGSAPHAGLTVTFCRAKPGHVLRPGRDFVGQVVVADIGIPDGNVVAHDAGLRVNAPPRWLAAVPQRRPGDHKYHFGHAVVVGGPDRSTGASRLSARAALRIGAGLVSVACSPDTLVLFALGTSAVMTKPLADEAAWRRLLNDDRLNAYLIGPGAGVGADTMTRVRDILEASRAVVLDADALTSAAACPTELFARLHDRCVLTPHEGEYARLFAHGGTRLDRARAAAAQTGAVMLLKGPDTIVASPDGRTAIQPAAPASLATAGSGDVLAGLVLGLLAQGMSAYDAACAAVWIHTAAAQVSGLGLIADDLPEHVPAVLDVLDSQRTS